MIKVNYTLIGDTVLFNNLKCFVRQQNYRNVLIQHKNENFISSSYIRYQMCKAVLFEKQNKKFQEFYML